MKEKVTPVDSVKWYLITYKLPFGRWHMFWSLKEGKTLPLFKVNTRTAALLKKFILEGGFDIDE